MADRREKSSEDLEGQKEPDSDDVKVSESSVGEKRASSGLRGAIRLVCLLS